MPTAKEIRDLAWKRLGEGSWLSAVSGFALIYLLTMAVSMALEKYGLVHGWIQNLTLSDILSQAKLLNPDVAAAPEFQALDKITVPRPVFWYQQVMIWTQVFWQGILAFGGTVLAIAVIRGGANVQQTFCGFSRPFKTGWLAVLQSVLIGLWALLLVVPGFCAFYSYRMAYFLLADNPEWSAGQALAESKKLMHGHRWRLACLDASFIGWMLLTWCTGGLGGIIVHPYMASAYAAFYEDLLDRSEA